MGMDPTGCVAAVQSAWVLKKQDQATSWWRAIGLRRLFDVLENGIGIFRCRHELPGKALATVTPLPTGA